MDSEQAEEIARDKRGPHADWLASAQQIPALSEGGDQILKDLVILAPALKLRPGRWSEHVVGLHVRHGDQAAGIRERQRSDQIGINHGEDHGVRPDSQCQRQDNYRCETGPFREHASRDSQIVPK
jgi:hypothetical protein